jgi:hypothetical protein
VQVADWMGELLGWSQARRAAELESYHGVKDGHAAREPLPFAVSHPRNDQPVASVV